MSTHPSDLPGFEPARIQRWSAADCPFAVDYAIDAIGGIRQQAVEAFHKLPHGGLEVGGLLFGRVYPNARAPIRLEIAAERPIECRHTSGPVFILSEEERTEVSALLERSRVDPEIAALSVIGYWVSHSRGELELTPDDRELYGKLFPAPWQVVLVLKPESGRPTRASFFFRVSGRIHPRNPQSDFYVEAQMAGAPVSAPHEQFQESASAPAQTTTIRSGVAFILMALFLVAGATAGAGLTYYLRDYWLPATYLNGHDPDLNLEIFTAGAGLLIHWNAKSVDVQHAARGVLTVHDGGDTQSYPFSPESLRRGFLRYMPHSDAIEAVLGVYATDGTLKQSQARYAAQ